MGNQEGGDPIGTGRLGAGQNQNNTAVLTGGDETLGAIQNIKITIALRTAAERLGIGTCFRFGQGKGADELAASHGYQKLLLLFFGAEFFNAAAADRVVH